MSDLLIFGASGYSGLELLRLLAFHPGVRVVGASSDKWTGTRVSDRVASWRSDLEFEGHQALLARATKGQVALLATPARSSAELAPKLLEAGVSVVDLSGAFRLRDPAQYPEWYAFEHPAPHLLETAVYGLPELLPQPSPSVRLVANPGCYATAAILAAAPLVRADLVEPSAPFLVDGKSGATGAGRTLDERLLFTEVAENLRPYRVAKHQHTPEIERALGTLARREVRVGFTAHLVPMRRGIVTSVYVTARSSTTQAAIDAAFDDAYRGATFIRICRDRPVETAPTSGNNFAEVAAVLDPRTGTICAFAAIDNLVKGAAGQAIQNLNALLGLPLETGLVGALA